MVSVSVVAYNQEDIISDAIKGVVGQRCSFPFELVIVDDNSTDGTFDVIKEWQQRYPHIIKAYRNPKNLGLQRNYFEAFSHCTGKYLALCDGDDYWCDASKLRRQIEYMEAHPECAITFHRVVNLYEYNGTMSFSNGSQRRDTTVTDLSHANYITNLSVIYRRECVDFEALPEWFKTENPLPDYALHLLFATHGTIHYFRRPMGVYRIRKTSTWSEARRNEQLQMALTVRQKFMEYFKADPRITPGLEAACQRIRTAMAQPADAPSTPLSKRIKASIRATVSKAIPTPRPPRIAR